MSNKIICIFFISILSGCGGCDKDIVDPQQLLRERCKTDNGRLSLLQAFPNIVQEELNAEIKNIQNISQETFGKTTSIVTIPVVVNIIGQSSNTKVNQAKVAEQIQILNEDFRKKIGSHGYGFGVDTNIEFCLTSVDENGNEFDGINELYGEFEEWEPWDHTSKIEMTSLIQFDPNKFLNIYVAELKPDIEPDGTVFLNLGHSHFPWDSYVNQSLDGVTIDPDFFGLQNDPFNNLGRTATHEVGHWLGLYHPFRNGCSNNDCQNEGDFVCDTPPMEKGTTCIPTNTCSPDSPNGDDLQDQIANYLTYSPDDCMNMFTEDQSIRIHSMLINYRSEILTASCSGDDDNNPTVPTNFEGIRLKATQIIITDKKDKPTLWVFGNKDDVSYVGFIGDQNCNNLGFASETELIDIANDEIGVVMDIEQDIDATLNSGYFLTPGTHMALMVYEQDGSGELQWNHNCGNLYGSSRNNAYGKIYINFDDFLYDNYEHIYPMQEGWIKIKGEFVQ